VALTARHCLDKYYLELRFQQRLVMGFLRYGGSGFAKVPFSRVWVEGAPFAV